jgi:integrase/recombinase XerD
MRGLYQRSGIFWARFKVRGHEYRASLRTRSRSVAERRLKALKEHVEETAYYGASDPVTWEEAVVSWSSAWARLGIKPRTGARYAQSLICCRPWLDGKKVHEIDNALLKSIVSARAKHGIKNATIRRDITAVSSVLGHCCDEGWIEENPAHMMDRSRFKEKKAKIILPRPDSIAYLFAEAGRMVDMAELSKESGMRQEEIAGLEHDRLDRKRMTVTLEDTKGNAVRVVPLTPHAVEIIDRQPRHFREKWVFWHGNGERYQNVDSDFYALGQRVARKAAQAGREFRRFRFHDLRHYFAVHYLKDRRGGLYDLQQVLGHKSVKTTEGYLDHLTPEEKWAAIHGVAQNPAQEERFGGENA